MANQQDGRVQISRDSEAAVARRKKFLEDLREMRMRAIERGVRPKSWAEMQKRLEETRGGH